MIFAFIKKLHPPSDIILIEEKPYIFDGIQKRPLFQNITFQDQKIP